jgi:hypothetical protein
MRARLINPKSRYIRVLFGSAITFFCVTVQLAVAAEPAASFTNLPDFAKKVHVTVAGDTVSLDEALRNAAMNERLTTYRQLRTEAGGSLDGQLELARWCRKQNLAEEERLHWQLALMMQPGQPEAMKALGLRMFDGQVLTKAQIAEAKKEAKLVKEAERKWATTIKRLKAAIEQDDPAAREVAVKEIDAIRDPRVMSLLEREFADGSTAAGLLVVEMYARAATQQAIDALARLAIHAKHAAVREKAAGELRYRTMEEYMPVLVGALSAPIEMSVRSDVELGGPEFESYNGYAHTGRLKVGLYGVVRLRSSYTNNDVLFWAPEVKPFSGSLFTGYRPDRHQVEYVLSCDSPDPAAPYEFHGGFEVASRGGPDGREPESIERSIAALQGRISELNRKNAELNLRIDTAIREATQAAAAANGQPPKLEKAADVRPRLWWDWWQQQLKLNNYFAKGTEVWTQFGIRPIEEVIVGDRVLTKNLDTGKLSFNLVIGVDQQRDAEVHAIEIDGRTIVATTDQPFFVPDQRWRRAQDLKPGTEVESLAGKARVESARPGAADETFSLLVEGNSNYFVDQQGILVHDATRK